MPFRVYHYLFNVLANELKENKTLKKLPAVQALVFYHGELTPYPYSLELSHCFDDPAKLMENFWQQPVPLIDINEFDDQQLLTQDIEGLMSIALKHGRDKEISKILLRIIQALLNLDFSEEIRLQFSERVAAYLYSVGKITDKQAFKRSIDKLPNPIRGKIMTFAEEMKIEGRVEGLVKGRVEGRVERTEEVAVNGLKQGLLPKLISQLTGLSLERIAQLKQEHQL